VSVLYYLFINYIVSFLAFDVSDISTNRGTLFRSSSIISYGTSQVFSIVGDICANLYAISQYLSPLFEICYYDYLTQGEDQENHRPSSIPVQYMYVSYIIPFSSPPLASFLCLYSYWLSAFLPFVFCRDI